MVNNASLATVNETAITYLAALLCDGRAWAMGQPEHKQPCDVCRRQAVWLLEQGYHLKKRTSKGVVRDVAEGQQAGAV